MADSGPARRPSDEGRLAVYQAVVMRRAQSDTMMWQVPALSLTAQAFLFTLALGTDTSRLARVLAAALSVTMALLSMQLMARHRQAEVTDTEWLAEHEDQNFALVAHGEEWRARRNKSPAGGWFARSRGFLVWMIGLAVFGAAASLILVLALFAPGAFSS